MKKYKDLFIALLAFLLYFTFSIAFTSIISLFNIDLKSQSILVKNIILIASDLIIMVLLFLIYRKEIIEDFKAFKNNKGRWFFRYLGIFVISVLVMGVLNAVLSKVTNDYIYSYICSFCRGIII